MVPSGAIRMNVGQAGILYKSLTASPPPSVHEAIGGRLSPAKDSS